MLRYKACRNSIVTLELLNDSVTNEKRKWVVDADHAKFRCNKAKVIDITNVKTGELMEGDLSIYFASFTYPLGEEVNVTYFDENLDDVCTGGIHYFKTKEAAFSWFYSQQDEYFPDGKQTTWYENGQKKIEQTFKGGLRDGKRISWYENGHKSYECTYKNGEKDGKWTQWHYNGNKLSEGTYKDGYKNGKWTEWWDNGQIKFEETYNGGIIVD